MPDSPSSSPTTLTRVIPSYLYVQYADDDALQAFVAAYNQLAQTYVDWFANGQLPVYTLQSGALLDWVARGLYGQVRPSLSSQRTTFLGPFGTPLYDQVEYAQYVALPPQNVVAVTDDVFRRIVTWNFYKGDGRTFNVRWLKRRVMRFLFGADGADTTRTNDTDQVSVTFGADGEVTITLVTGTRTVTGGAIFDFPTFNSVAYDELDGTFVALAPLPNAQLFQEAMESGVLQFPFQFTPVVNVGI